MLALLTCFALLSPGASAADAITIFMIGDSTMADKPMIPENPERGWGQLLTLYFTPNVTVDNHATNGRSSKSFRSEGRWDVVLQQIRPGDFVIIQFGHNDEKADEARHTEPFGSYTENLRRYAKEASERGAIPILATPVVRRVFDDEGVLQPTHGDYPDAVRKLAQAIDVPLLDMTLRSRDLIERLGKERSEGLFIWTVPGEYSRFPKGNSDNTHFNALGATRMCDLVIAEIQAKVPELAVHLKTGR
ncbi:pectinesterase [Rhodopirellula maiorica SM1]|uniref:Pectinesterase n=1 Tax=Rhodopirellula maiorica SM1 TaxID=1265738 RepID=M5RED4_9BACT|nr:pectinesterase [Rhodopirellula maiorica SM1]